MIWVPPAFRERPYARARFVETVEWALAAHPFYKSRFTQPVDYIPRLTRPEVAANNDALLAGRPQTGATSGSTGLPVRISWSGAKATSNQAANDQFAALMGGPLPRVRLVSLVGQPPNSPELMDICEPLAAQVAFIEKRRRDAGIRALVTYPTNAVLLAEWLAERGRAFDFIERIVLFAEPWEPDDFVCIQRGFPNARVWSTYSCSELGFIAYTCPNNPRRSHVVATEVGVEVNREGDTPAAVGEVGQLVLTDFANRAAPFIRYEIGDLAIPGVCDCGIPTPALEKILGRVRGFLRRPDGSRVMFANVTAQLRDTPGLRQYQVVQPELERLRLRYVPDEGTEERVLLAEITRLIHQFLGAKPTIEFERVDTIERGANGKLHLTICEV